MKTLFSQVFVCLAALSLAACSTNRKSTPPPIATGPSAAPSQKVRAYEHRPAPAPEPLVTPEQVQLIIGRFAEAYKQLGSPKMLIYVNRNLVDEQGGLKLIARHETTRTTNDSTVEHAENRYKREAPPEFNLADRQTVRDIERLFGRPLRMAGVKLADQRTASQLIPAGRFQSLMTEGEQARKDREALSKIADVALEILVSSKDVAASTISGTTPQVVPDIHATAIRLSDARVLGQAASSDILNPASSASAFRDVREIAEATALALMEDLTTDINLPKEDQ